ncbi:amidohydrolase family protein [Aquiluna sp.]|nr:amidohydrolase family protein [Aquiluna sp.]
MILIHSVSFAGRSGDDNWVLFDREIREIGHGESWRDLEFDESLDGSGHLLSRPFIETHTHGLEGHAVEDGIASMRAIRESQRKYGIARSILSLVSLPQSRILELIAEAKVLMGEDPGFLGLHLEGPYIAEARCGAHDKEALRKPTDAELNEIVKAAQLETGGSVIASITIAAELFSNSQLSLLTEAGIALCLGHTEANYEQAKDFFGQSRRVLTHTYNAMQPIGHRDPGPIPAAIEAPNTFLELIADGHHVKPSAANILPQEKLILVSDSMAAAAQSDGKYMLGTLEVTVADGVATTASGSLAGSTLTLDKAVENYVLWGNSLEQSVRCAVANPAAAYGLRVAPISAGETADLLLIGPNGQLVRTFGF